MWATFSINIKIYVTFNSLNNVSSIILENPLRPEIVSIRLLPSARIIVIWSFYGYIEQMMRYSIQLKKARDSNNWITIKSGPVVQTRTESLVVYSSLRPFMEYAVRILLFTNEGENLIGDIRKFKSDISEPYGPPTNVVARHISPSNIVIRWQVSLHKIFLHLKLVSVLNFWQPFIYCMKVYKCCRTIASSNIYIYIYIYIYKSCFIKQV